MVFVYECTLIYVLFIGENCLPILMSLILILIDQNFEETNVRVSQLILIDQNPRDIKYVHTYDIIVVS